MNLDDIAARNGKQSSSDIRWNKHIQTCRLLEIALQIKLIFDRVPWQWIWTVTSCSAIVDCNVWPGIQTNQGLAWASPLTWIFQGTGKKHMHAHTVLLTELQCIIMKIKDILITAAKWYWTSVNASEGTSKNEDSWTSHKMKSLSAYAWGCEWGVQAPDRWTRNGSTLPWARWLLRESSTSLSHIRSPNPQLLLATQGSTSGPPSIHLDSS